MVNFRRWLRHVFAPPWAWRRAFPQTALDVIETAVRQSETRHGGEIRVAIENSLAPGQAWRGLSGRDRAIDVFSQLRVWDTEHNSGVLIYLLLADHDIEIVVDRGIAARVQPNEWEKVVRIMESHFRAGRHEAAVLAGIAAVSTLLEGSFTPGTGNPDELSNRPAILRR